MRGMNNLFSHASFNALAAKTADSNPFDWIGGLLHLDLKMIAILAVVALVGGVIAGLRGRNG